MAKIREAHRSNVGVGELPAHSTHTPAAVETDSATQSVIGVLLAAHNITMDMVPGVKVLEPEVVKAILKFSSEKLLTIEETVKLLRSLYTAAAVS